MLSYQQQFIRFMAVSGKHPSLIPFPTDALDLGVVPQCHLGAADHRQALIQGLKHDLIADDRALRALIPQTLIPFDPGGSPHAEKKSS